MCVCVCVKKSIVIVGMSIVRCPWSTQTPIPPSALHHNSVCVCVCVCLLVVHVSDTNVCVYGFKCLSCFNGVEQSKCYG